MNKKKLFKAILVPTQFTVSYFWKHDLFIPKFKIVTIQMVAIARSPDTPP